LFSLHLFYGYALCNLAIQATETNKCVICDLICEKYRSKRYLDNRCKNAPNRRVRRVWKQTENSDCLSL